MLCVVLPGIFTSKATHHSKSRQHRMRTTRTPKSASAHHSISRQRGVQDEDHAFRKIRLRVEEVQGRSCLTNFRGMTFTTDKIRSLVRKWQSLIEAHVDVKTTDGYMIRLFCIAFTKKRQGQVAKTCYAQVRCACWLLASVGPNCRCCALLRVGGFP